MRETCYLMQRRQTHVLSEWAASAGGKDPGRRLRTLTSFNSSFLGAVFRAPKETSDCQASLNSIRSSSPFHLVTLASSETQAVFLHYTSYCGWFLLLWLHTRADWPMSLPASLFGLLRFILFTLNTVLDLDPILRPGPLGDHETFAHGLYRWRTPWIGTDRWILLW